MGKPTIMKRIFGILLYFAACTPLFSAELISGYTAAMQRDMDEIRARLENIIQPVWREKFAYWEKNPPSQPLNTYLPDEVLEKVKRCVGLELGRISETMRYSERFAISAQKQGAGKTTAVCLWRGEIQVPLVVEQHPTGQQIAKYAIARSIEDDVPISQKCGQMYFNGYPTNITLDGEPTKGITIHLTNTKVVNRNIFGVPSIAKLNDSYFWGYLQRISQRPGFCTDSVSAKVYYPKLHGAKYHQQRVGVYMLLHDYATLPCTISEVAIYYAD